MTTLLSLIQTTCDELGLSRPAVAATDPSLQTRQLVALMNRIGQMLASRNGWTALQAEWPIAIGAPTDTTGDLTVGSAIVTNIPTTAAITATTFSVSGTNVQIASRVASVDSATQITMNQPALATEVGAALSFVKDTFALPSDFAYFTNDTMWDRTNHWQLIGPITPQIDQWQRSGIMTTGPRRRWRQIGKGLNVFRIWPPPTSTDTPAEIVFEYVSNGWVAAAAGTYKAAFTLDTDTCVFNDDMMISGTKYLFFQAKGFDYEPYRRQFEAFYDSNVSQDGGSPTLSLTRRRLPYLISAQNVQDGNYPG